MHPFTLQMINSHCTGHLSSLKHTGSTASLQFHYYHYTPSTFLSYSLSPTKHTHNPAVLLLWTYIMFPVSQVQPKASQNRSCTMNQKISVACLMSILTWVNFRQTMRNVIKKCIFYCTVIYGGQLTHTNTILSLKTPTKNTSKYSLINVTQL